jgi:CDP-diacylglycerol--serine O-phosphatidyltransferase
VNKLINLKEVLTAIDPSKKCLSFLSDRILSDNYRGIHVSQHFRYDMNDIVAVLNELYKIAGDNLLKIRTTDNSKRPMNTADENNYAMFVNNVNAAIKKGGQDSVRKNIFPDMHRMGLIDRYDGRVARFLKVSSDLGKELDSLADLVSFGVAPSILVFNLNNFVHLGLIGYLLVVIFPIAGAYRLARYNSTPFNNVFTGIPITITGTFLALYSLLTINSNSNQFVTITLVLILSYLMVSKLQFKKV